LHIDMPPKVISPGTLYVVGTPIGNLEDITLRALRVLGAVDLIAAEDTRQTQKLLEAHQIQNRLISYHEHNEEQRSEQLLKEMSQGKSIALASDAGMPTISDPGFRIIQRAQSLGFAVIPVPGVSAVLTALSVSGLPTDMFTFVGFLPKKQGARQRQLQALSNVGHTLVFFESPHRLTKLLEEMLEAFGDRQAFLAREMTKRYEEFIRGRLSEILHKLMNRQTIKGECTVLVEGRQLRETTAGDAFKAELTAIWEARHYGASALAKQLARKYQIPKKLVYDEILRLKDAADKEPQG
jgi:16S rRNA (cytidine1402-2'-O)-methyltransferase